jgi:hypothetical protein
MTPKDINPLDSDLDSIPSEERAGGVAVPDQTQVPLDPNYNSDAPIPAETATSTPTPVPTYIHSPTPIPTPTPTPIPTPTPTPGECLDRDLQTRVRFQKFLAKHGSSCMPETQSRTCENGAFTNWSGTFKVSACSVLERSLTNMTQIDLEAVAAAYNMTVPAYLLDQFNRFKPSVFVATDTALFQTYSSAAVSPWRTNWLSNLDFSGVGWDSPYAGTLVTSQHVVFASHFQRPLNYPIVFHDRDGNPVTRTIASLRSVPNIFSYTPDITIAKLSSPVPDSVFSYPVLKPYLLTKMNTDLSGAPYLVSDKLRNIFVHKVSFMNTNSINGTKDTSLPDFMSHILVSGDSGNPAFIIVEGMPVLMSTHTFAGYGGGPSYSSQDNQTKILLEMSQLP